MKNLLILFFLILLVPTNDKYQTTTFVQGEIEITITNPAYLQPGSNILIEIQTSQSKKEFKAKFNNKEISILSKHGKLFYLIGIDIRSQQTIHNFLLYQKIQDKDFQEIFRYSFTIKKLSAPKVDFGKEPKRSKQFLEKYFEERKIYNQILEKTESDILFEEPFSMPLEKMEITGTFGDQRTYSDTKNARIHRGIDLKAPTGTEVYAINDGKVLMAKNFTFEGNFIAIDHGGGIISFYMHLSEFKVKEGDLVKKGQLIGLSGSTGNSNSPHLHFSIKINKETTDPLEFMEIINKFLKQENGSID